MSYRPVFQKYSENFNLLETVLEFQNVQKPDDKLKKLDCKSAHAVVSVENHWPIMTDDVTASNCSITADPKAADSFTIQVYNLIMRW